MAAYYNDNEKYVCEWLRNLIKAGLIPDGDVDNRSIRDVQPEDLRGYTQCHFFAGIGGWAYALRLAGWPDDREVWTGSCPCQPFSSAGKQLGFEDERHLWPAWFDLIRECRPSTIFGEQVARAVGLGWLDAVADDMESEGYSFGTAVLPACAVAAPHDRERLWFVADARSGGFGELHQRVRELGRKSSADARCNGEVQPLAHTNLNVRHEWRFNNAEQGPRGGNANRGCVGADVMANAYRSERQRQAGAGGLGRFRGEGEAKEVGPRLGFEWPAEPDLPRVAHGVLARVAKLRAFGNAIVPQVAAEFIRAFDKAQYSQGV